jgi:hypothetical protein
MDKKACSKISVVIAVLVNLLRPTNSTASQGIDIGIIPEWEVDSSVAAESEGGKWRS